MSNEAKYQTILNSQSSRLCVIAGPGTGKTKCVLIPKTEALLAAGVAPEEILLLSFSRLSAADLKNRVHSGVSASTVHSCCLAFLLSENNHEIRDRINSLVFEFEEDVLLWDLKVVFPHLHKKKDLEEMFKEYKAGWATAQRDSVLEHDEKERRFKYAVMNWLKEHSAALLGEIMYSGVELIGDLESTGILAKHKYILVDEYQDLNKLEQEFVGQIAAQAHLLLVVGDPDQSIYSFKFAHPDGIQEFKNSAEYFYLEYCGRCARNIVTFANQLLVQANPERTLLPRSLPTNIEGEVIPHAPFETQNDEFRYVIDAIARRLREKTKPEEILVLVPKKALADEFIASLTPCDQALLTSLGASVKVTGKSKYSDTEKRAILMFALAATSASLLHMRTYLGLNDDKAYATEFRILKEKYGDLKAALNQASPRDFSERDKRVRRLCEDVAHLKESLSAYEGRPLEEVIDSLFPADSADLSWVREVLMALKEDGDTLAALYYKFTDYVRSSSQKPGVIRVMTLNMSKGLDAEHVFILGASSGNIPGKNYSRHLSDAKFIEEQRRLLYVGITRAKFSITITWSRTISYHQSQTHQTSHVGVRRRPGGKTEVRLTICEFLQGLRS